MADNYLQFSETVECTKDKALWLQTELDIAVDPGDGYYAYPACTHSYHADKGYVWVRSDGDIDALLDTIAKFQLEFKIENPWSIQWSWTCSKPRVGEFGGGAAVVYKGKIHSAGTSQWCEDKIKELMK